MYQEFTPISWYAPLHQWNDVREMSFIASSASVDPTMIGVWVGKLPSSWVFGPWWWWAHLPSSSTMTLEMQLVPELPLWLFRNDSVSLGEDTPFTVRFKLIRSINIVYYNSEPKDLFGIRPRKYDRTSWWIENQDEGAYDTEWSRRKYPSRGNHWLHPCVFLRTLPASSLMTNSEQLQIARVCISYKSELYIQYMLPLV